MKKDIEVPKVKAVYVAAIIEINEQLEEVWTVHVINDQERAIEGVLVTSKGYEVENDIQYQRSTLLRHSIGDVAAKSSEWLLLKSLKSITNIGSLFSKTVNF